MNGYKRRQDTTFPVESIYLAQQEQKFIFKKNRNREGEMHYRNNINGLLISTYIQ